LQRKDTTAFCFQQGARDQAHDHNDSQCLLSCFVRSARIGIISFVCCARIIIYIYCPATGCSLFDMSHPNSPVAKETLKDHVGSSTVPSNATLQIRVSKPWSLRKFSPRRRSPQKRHNRYKIILPRPDTQLALRPNSPLRKGGFSLDPPVACPPHPHPNCNCGLLIRVCVLFTYSGANIVC